MDFSKQNITNYYLYDTTVDNMFIAEYMATAPGEYVKAYLLALMYADLCVPCTNEGLAKQLSLPVEEVMLSWNHWEKLGLIKKHYPDPKEKLRYTVEFLNIREAHFGKKTNATIKGSAVIKLTDDELAQLYRDIEAVTGRLFEGKELEEIACWIAEHNISPDVILFGYKYCTLRRKSSKYRYVGTILKDWNQKGFKSISDIELYLEDTDSRHFIYKRVLKALGFMRNATEEERRIMDTWLDDMNFDIERVLDACKKTSGISNPNINYINSVLVAWKKEEAGSSDRATGDSLYTKVMNLYEKDREDNEQKTRENMEIVFSKVPKVRDLIGQLRESSYRLSKAMLMGVNGSDSMDREKKKMTELIEEKARLLADNGFSVDATDTVYTCKLCKDTSMLESGQRCSCFNEKAERLESSELR